MNEIKTESERSINLAAMAESLAESYDRAEPSDIPGDDGKSYSYMQLEKLLSKKGITRYRLCHDLGLVESTTTKWKKTGHAPKYKNLRKIASYFGVAVDYFYKLTD